MKQCNSLNFSSLAWQYYVFQSGLSVVQSSYKYVDSEYWKDIAKFNLWKLPSDIPNNFTFWKECVDWVTSNLADKKIYIDRTASCTWRMLFNKFYLSFEVNLLSWKSSSLTFLWTVFCHNQANFWLQHLQRFHLQLNFNVTNLYIIKSSV